MKKKHLRTLGLTLPDEPAATQTPAASNGDTAPAAAPAPPALPPGAQIIDDPETVAAMNQIQGILQGQGAVDPLYLLGQAHLEIARLRASLNVAIGELGRLEKRIQEAIKKS